MKVLIGTPIHESKDYSMQKWLRNVVELQSVTPADLLLVDSSPGEKYLETVKDYCRKTGAKNYKLQHIEVHQANGMDEMVGRSREAIRQEILAHDYDAWLSWECDLIIPKNTLEKLTALMVKGDYQIINPNTWSSVVKTEPITNFGCALIRRDCLQKYGFLLEYPTMPGSWHNGEAWFKKQVLEGGGNYIEVYGLINPVHRIMPSGQ